MTSKPLQGVSYHLIIELDRYGIYLLSFDRLKISLGGVAERLKAAVLKIVVGGDPYREFESHPLRSLTPIEPC